MWYIYDGNVSNYVYYIYGRSCPFKGLEQVA